LFTPKLLRKENLVADIWSFTFEVPHHFEWQGGQHVVVILEHPNPDSRGTARALSIATAPFEKSLVLITHCPDEGSSFKYALRDLKLGATVQMTPPQASFHADFTGEPTVIVAGGVGAVAIRSMLMDADHQGTSISCRLAYYAPSNQHLFKDDFELLAKKQPGFSVQYLIDENLQEVGALKETEDRSAGHYYFSGVYAREVVSAEELQAPVSESSSEARKEVERLAKMSGLVH